MTAELTRTRSLVDIQPESGQPSVATLRNLQVISPTQILAGQELIRTTRGGESFVMGYRLSVFNQHTGTTEQLYLKEKCIVSMGDMRGKAAAQYRRAQYLERAGVPMPKQYGVEGATVYSEYIVNDKTTEALAEIKAAPSTEAAKPLLDQIITIAAIIDQSGFTPLHMLGDLIFDGDRRQFLYMDTGSDLGTPNPDQPKSGGLNALKESFRKYEHHLAYIDAAYAEKVTQLKDEPRISYTDIPLAA